MTKSPSGEKNGLKRGPWTPEEDQKLVDYIQKHGHGKWRTLPKNAGLKRCGKSCRLRWTNYLRPDIKRGRFSYEEEEAIIQLHSVLGNKWSTIAASLPGRTDNEIKNYWNTHIKKRLLKMGIDPVTHAPCLDLQLLSSILNSSPYNSSPQLNYPGLFGMGSILNPSLLSLLASLLSSQNPNVINQNFQQNQCQSSQSTQLHSIPALHPNQPQVPVQENQSCAASINPSTLEYQLLKAKLDQIPPSNTNFSHQNTLPNLWQYNGGHLDEPAMQSFSSPCKFNSMVNNLLGDQILQNNVDMPNFNLGSLLSSTNASTSPSTLNSSSSTTFVNGARVTEDESDTYCSNMLMYNISSGLNIINDSGLL